MHSHHLATARGISDAEYCDLVTGLDSSVAGSAGRGFLATPFLAEPRSWAGRLACTGGGGVWVKNETGNVSGSHKGRHLFGVLVHLTVMERIGVTGSPGTGPAWPSRAAGTRRWPQRSWRGRAAGR